jgi:hypothetical protein
MKNSYFTLITLLSLYGILTNNCEAKAICVDANATISGEGTCWEKPFLTLQEALDLGENDKSVSEIWIAKGIYKPSKTYSPKNKDGHVVLGGALSLKENNPGILVDNTYVNYHDNPAYFNRYLKTFQLIDSVNLYGGFQGQSGPLGGEKSKSERDKDPQLHQTILDGALDGYQVWHVITAGNDITLEGVNTTLDRLVIRNGNAISAPYYPTHFPLKPNEVPIYYHDDGGGIYIFTKSKIKLQQMILENNAGIAGGAIYVEDGSGLDIIDSTFRSNVASDGGAINMRSGGPNEYSNYQYSRNTKLTMKNCEFSNNASFKGSAILFNDTQSNPPFHLLAQNIYLDNCRFINNYNIHANAPNTNLSISLLLNTYQNLSQKNHV